MYSIEKSAKSVEEALKLALDELNLTREKVEVEIIDEPVKKVLGLFGGKDAKIKVSVIEEVVETEEFDVKAVNFLNSVFENMKIEGKITTRIEDTTLYIDVEGPDMALLIGRRGQTLDALQYLVSLTINKNKDDYTRVILDTENYRKKRKETLEKLAYRLAKKAKKLRKDIVLEPMNPYERRIIHSALQTSTEVSTRSEGEEPYRKVVIFLNR
jgi:spoIIIJ-associated protein